jgi:uncharacterized membrane protein
MSTMGDAFRRVGGLDAHHRLFVALGGAAAAFLLTMAGHWSWSTRVLIAWNVHSLCVLILTWIAIIHADPEEAARTAQLQDSGRTAIFVFVIIAACASLFTVGALLGSAKGLDKAQLTEHVIFAAATVLFSWTLVHTVFTMRYAHVYYGLNDQGKSTGGLNFPDEDEPDYLDFAYFSFIIGMTCQVSDVSISSRRLRRLALVHGLIAFVFNAAIVAMSVNLISGLF